MFYVTITFLIILFNIVLLILLLCLLTRKNSPTPTSTFPSTTKSHGSMNMNQIYTGSKLLDLFLIYQATDPTQGCVNYKYFSQIPNDLCNVDSSGNLYIGTAGANFPVEASTVPIIKNSIPSIRIYTKEIFNGGLFSFHLLHVPEGMGVWPAIWFSQDPNQTLPDGQQGVWPNNGEFDLFEEINNNSTNQSTLHIGGYTTKGLCPYECQFDGGPCSGCFCPTDCKESCGSSFCPYTCNPVLTGQIVQGSNSNCTTFGSNPGCGIAGPPNSFGKDFNSTYGEKGAVLSMNWEKKTEEEYIITCYFITDLSIINDTTNGPFSKYPDPSLWSSFQYAKFDSTSSSTCPFKNAQLIINITLCGVWAGAQFQNCNDYVSNPVNNLKEAYFKIAKYSYLKPIHSNVNDSKL